MEDVFKRDEETIYIEIKENDKEKVEKLLKENKVDFNHYDSHEEINMICLRRWTELDLIRNKNINEESITKEISEAILNEIIDDTTNNSEADSCYTEFLAETIFSKYKDRFENCEEE